jgi:hypothetical protein
MPERLVRAAVQAGLEAAGREQGRRSPHEQAARVAELLAAVADLEMELLSADENDTRPLRSIGPVVGFDAPAAEGTGHVPWYAD